MLIKEDHDDPGGDRFHGRHRLSVIKEIFEQAHFRHLLVVEDEVLVGVISDRDLLRAISPYLDTGCRDEPGHRDLNRRAHQIMSRHPITISPSYLARRRRHHAAQHGLLPAGCWRTAPWSAYGSELEGSVEGHALVAGLNESERPVHALWVIRLFIRCSAVIEINTSFFFCLCIFIQLVLSSADYCLSLTPGVVGKRFMPCFWN